VIVKPPRLVSALVVKPRTGSSTGRVELQPSIPLLSSGQPALERCTPTGRARLTSPWSPGRLLFLQIAEVWGPFIKTRECIPS